MTLFIVLLSIIGVAGVLIFLMPTYGVDSTENIKEEDEPFSEEFVDFMDGDDNNFF